MKLNISALPFRRGCRACRWCQALAFLLLSLSNPQAAAQCIGVVTAGAGDDFWQSVKQGALAAGEEIALPVIVRGAKQEKDFRGQWQIIEHMVKSGCTGLVIAPNSPKRAAQVEALAEQGIHTVYIDRDVGGTRSAVIMTNNVAAGQLAAQEMQNHLAPQSNIAIFRLDPLVQSTSERERGFIDAMESAGHRIVLDLYLGTDTTMATENAYRALLGMRGVHAIFTPNESTTLKVLNMRKRVTQTQQLVHVGFDANPVFLEQIKTGHLTAVVVQNPHRMGYEAVKTVHAVMLGKPYSPLTHTPSRIVNQTHPLTSP